MRLSLLSKYRTQIMGLLMIWIMLYHNYFKWSGKSIVRTVIGQGNVGVDAFLFLSGMGLYFAYDKNKNIGSFYRKRIVRLLVPYVVLGIPYYIWVVLSKEGAYSFFEYFFQIAFVKHNVTTTWFIPCILILSLLFPLIYQIQNQSCRIGNYDVSRNTVTLFICFIYFVFLLFLKSYCVTFYNNTEIALTRALIFIIGAHAGKYVKEDRKLPGGTVFFCIVFIIIYTFVFREEIKLTAFWIRMSYIPLSVSWLVVFAALLSGIDNSLKNVKFRFLSFTGKMTLELYLLHIMIRRIYAHYLGFPYIEKTAVVDYLIVIILSFAISALLHPLFNKITQFCIRRKSN